MIIGYDPFGYQLQGNSFITNVYHPNYNKIELKNMTLDEIYIDEDITISNSTEKPNGWNYRTVLDAKLQGNIEGGSISAGGLEIEKIRFQRRLSDELYWEDIGQIDYKPHEQLLYEVIDKFVQNDFTYQYSLVPYTSNVMGNRVTSDEITVAFDGVFLSDKNNNYKLFYDIETDDIEHNIASAILQPLNSKYPIVSYGEANYKSGGITATFLSIETVNRYDGKITIKAEKLGRQRLMEYLTNRKPKVLRHQNGETMLINIVGTPKEIPDNNINGKMGVSFNYVEVGGTDSETLKANDMLIGFEEEF